MCIWVGFEEGTLSGEFLMEGRLLPATAATDSGRGECSPSKWQGREENMLSPRPSPVHVDSCQSPMGDGN